MVVHEPQRAVRSKGVETMDSLYTLTQVADAHRDDLLRQAQPEYRLVRPERQRFEFLRRTVGMFQRRMHEAGSTTRPGSLPPSRSGLPTHTTSQR